VYHLTEGFRLARISVQEWKAVRGIVLKRFPGGQILRAPRLIEVSGALPLRFLNRFIGFLSVARVAYRTVLFSILLELSQETVGMVPPCFFGLVVTPMNRGAVERDFPSSRAALIMTARSRVCWVLAHPG
jgi:hypothetical protein